MADDSPQAGSESSRITNIATRGIVVWLWLGLLTAYISTSALYSGQLMNGLMGGFREYLSPSISRVILAYSTVPAFLVAVGWVTFYQFTISIYRTLTFLDSEDQVNIHKEGLYNPKVMRSRFGFSVMLLVMSWVASLLIVATAPLVINLRYGF